jgi:hypothetical protein
MANVFAKPPEEFRHAYRLLNFIFRMKRALYLGIGITAAFFFLAGLSAALLVGGVCLGIMLILPLDRLERLAHKLKQSSFYRLTISGEGFVFAVVICGSFAAAIFILWRHYNP